MTVPPVLVPDDVTHVRVLSTEEALRAELARMAEAMAGAARELMGIGHSEADGIGRDLQRLAQEIAERAGRR